MAIKKGKPHITVEHLAGGKHKVTDHPTRKAAKSFGMQLRRAGRTVFSHSANNAKKFGLDPRHPLAEHSKNSAGEKSGVHKRPEKPAEKAKAAPPKSPAPSKAPSKPAARSPSPVKKLAAPKFGTKATDKAPSKPAARPHTPVKKMDAPKFGTKSTVKAPSRAGKKAATAKGKVKPGLTPKEPKRQFKGKVSTGQRHGKIAKKGPARPKGAIKQKSAERKFKPAAKPSLMQKLKTLGGKKIDVKGAVSSIKNALTKKRSLKKPAAPGGSVGVGKRGGRFKFSRAGKKIYLHKK